MEWSDSMAADALVGRPLGQVDEVSWEPFLAAMSAAIARAGEAGIGFVLDLSGLDNLSPRGLRAIGIARRGAEARGVEMRLAAPSREIRAILAASRYDRLLPVSDAVGTALAHAWEG